MVKDTKKEFSAFSALFNQVTDSMFVRDNLSSQISSIYEDFKETNLEILDENRLRRKLFNKIVEQYGERKEAYGLILDPIKPEERDSLEIKTFYLTTSSDGTSGEYSIFPRVFYCDQCGDFQVYYSDEIWKYFTPRCKQPDCEGKYVQFPFVEFCEDCGNISDKFKLCEKHYSKYLKLIQYDVSSPITWKLRCTKCDEEWDFLSECYHYKDEKKILKKPKSTYKPINVQQGSVSKSVVETTVDIPRIETLQKISLLDYVSFALYAHQFDKIKEDIPKIMHKLPKILNHIDIEEYNSIDDLEKIQNIDNRIINSLDIFLKTLKKIYTEYKNDGIVEEINDYLILTGYYYRLFGINNLSEAFTIIRYNFDDEDYDQIKEKFGIKDTFYISEIQLISSSIGSIKGMNKAEPNFVPHFEPHRDPETNALHVISYPFRTEALLIDLDKIKIVKWLIDNELLDEDYPQTEKKAENILMNLGRMDETAFNAVNTLIHTFSHVLLKRSSLYTGLDSDSLSEMLFPSIGAFLIYSTSNINIGGLSYVFENDMAAWFNNVELDVNDCVFDPTCIDEEGACFSCVYLPEFVCCNLNKDLDRDVFLGSSRYDKGFWQ